MRKIVSFILLLCLAIGARPETVKQSLTGFGSATTIPLDEGLYVFECNGRIGQRTTYMCAGGTNNANFSATSTLPSGIDAMTYVWRLKKEGDTWKIINVATGKQLTFESASNGGNVTLTDAGTAVTIEANGEYVGLKNANGQYIDMGYFGTSPSTLSDGVSGSSRMTILKANITNITFYAITYNFKYNSDLIGSKSFEVESGQSLPPKVPTSKDLTSSYADPSLLDFAFPTVKATADAEYDVAVTIGSKFPVTLGNVTNDFGPGTKFYTMKLSESGKYVRKDEYNDYFTASSDQSDNSAPYLFAITGDPVNGFNLYNSEVGASKVIYDNTPGNSDNDPIPTEANPNGKWSIGMHPNGKFWLRQGNSGTWYMTSRNSKLGFWDKNNPVGSNVSEIEFAFVTAVPPATLQTGKIYTIQAKDASRGALFVADGSDKFDVCVNVDATNPNQQFAFVKEGNLLYLYNVGQKKFATRADSKVGASYIPANYVTVVESDQEGYYHILFDGTEKLSISATDGCEVLNSNTVDDGNRLQFTLLDGTIDAEHLTQYIPVSKELASKIPQLKDPASFGQGVNTYSSNEPAYAELYNWILSFYADINNGGENSLDLVQGLNELTDDLIESIRLNMPETGKFYRFKNSNKYLTSNLQEGSMKMEDASTASNTRESIFFLTEDNELIAYANGLYTKNFTSGNYGFEAVGSAGNKVSFEDGNEGSASPVYHISCNNYYIYGASGNSVLDAGDGAGTDTGYDWTIEEVEYLPVVVSETVNHGTLYTPVALSLPKGLTAYTGSINGNSLSLNPVSDVIPAGSAVVLKDEGAERDETTRHIYLQVSNSTAPAVQGNALSGQINTIAAVANAYTLQNNATTGLGFYPFTGATLAGFKAYLLNGFGVRGFAFQEGETTSIEAAEGTQLNEPIYDLSGRRVQKATKGLFIVGGKKVFIK